MSCYVNAEVLYTCNYAVFEHVTFAGCWGLSQ